ncbi:metallophosphoesterase [candidate division FCPU426 bacterium]|nr:metallophosphoesterase [candidate division FCPU426 bacterium]
MIRLLALADEASNYLENYLTATRPADIPLDLLVSCGDLDASYLDFCATASGRMLYYVNGNHETMPKKEGRGFGEDLHGRALETRHAILCGFGGARWYKPGEYQFLESEMRWLTRMVRWQIWKIRLRGRLFKTPQKPVIVLSHAPPAGIHDQENSEHQGFACFKTFMRAVRPVIWLHGHVHLPNLRQIQKTVCQGTTVLNVFQFKYIVLQDTGITVDYQLPKHREA